MNSSLITLSFQYLDNNYKTISNISTWIFNILVMSQYEDRKIIRSLFRADIDIANLIINLIYNKEIIKLYSHKIISTFKFSKDTFHHIVKLLVLHDLCDIHYDNDYVLTHSIENNDIDLIKFILEHYSYECFDLDKLLETASYDGHYDIIKFLLDNGAHVKTKALIYACDRNCLEIVKLLLDNISEITQVDYIQAFIESCTYGYIDIVKYLLDNCESRNFNKKDIIQTEDNRPLVFACQFGYISQVESFIKNGADVNARNGSALEHACHKGNYDIAKLLIDNGADVKNNNALMHAYKNNYPHIIKLLLDNGSYIYKNNNVAINFSKENNSFEIIDTDELN